MKLQMAILAKVFAQDASLQQKNRIRIHVVYEQDNPDSSWMKTEFIELATGLSTLTIGGRKVDTEAITTLMVHKNEPPDIFFACTLSEASWNALAKTALEKKVRCFGSDPNDARRGAAVAVGISQDKPKIIINGESARSQGARFSNDLLKLAEVI